MIPDADIVWDKREQSRIEAQIKKQQELKLIGRMKKVPGHTLFSFNYKTGEIKPADVIRECAMAVDAEKEGRFIPAQEILKGIQKSKTDN